MNKINTNRAVVLEDVIMQKGMTATAGSKILENFISPFSAAAADRLTDNGYVIAGRTKTVEFGIEDFFDDDNGEVPGAISAVAEGSAGYALCNDLFGRYRRTAPGSDCCYIHPTYGTVSRYGLIPLASSMDRIGVVCKSLPGGFELLSLIAGKDPNDGAMFPEERYNYAAPGKAPVMGVPEQVIARADAETREAIHDLAGRFNAVNIDLEHFDLYKQVMYILSCAEIANNISRYDGIKYGYRASDYRDIDELYVKTRSEGFGRGTKLTAIMGAMVLSQRNYAPYYEKAMKLRRKIKESVRFDTYDIIVLPCAIEGDRYDNLSLWALSGLAGLPSVTFSYKGRGVQLIAGMKNEGMLLKAGEVCMA
ncbi:MAG: amidase family protein [Eubacteriales bacterium]|nr:amidase family protein [Eubacteriales bacterium]